MATTSKKRRNWLKYDDRYAVIIERDGNPDGELGVGIKRDKAERIGAIFNRHEYPSGGDKAVIRRVAIKVLGTVRKAARKAVKV